VLKKAKDSLFYYLVEKNPHILHRYQEYKWGLEGKENKIKSWSYIGALNLTHRVLKINSNQSYQHHSQKTSRSTINNNLKLPYLDGAESSYLKRPTVNQLAKDILQYDVISFDVFDTLVLRPFAQPHDLFMILAEKFNITNFLRIRRNAEAEARKLATIKNGNHEVTLSDIYELIEYKTGLDKEYGVKVELETELEFCFANPYMMEVFKILKEHNKKIIAASDMYVTKQMLIAILEKCGYTGFDKIYVSSEYNGSKRDKNLYKIILSEKDKADTLVHIGDNYVTDIQHSKEMGIESRYYPNVHDVGNKFRADGMSELTGSIYSGLVNTYLHNGVRQYSPVYEYGFTYGGLYVLGYCQWIYNYAKKNNIDKVIFLSRDGEIYRKVFNMLFDDMDNEYMYWSRIANTKYTIEKNREDFLTKMVLHKAINVVPVQLNNLLNSLGLNSFIPLLSNYKLSENDLLHRGNVKLVENLFVDNWDLVVDTLNKDLDLVEHYFKTIIKDSKKIAVVDVGWVGSGGAGIKYLIEEKFNLDCEVKSLVAASRNVGHIANIHDLMKEDLNVYMFSRMKNRNLYDTHSNTNNNTNNIYFELFTQATYPSFAGFKRTKDGYSFEFDVPEVENYEVIQEIHDGIIDFVRLFRKTFGGYTYLQSISGYDAYLPYRMIIRDLSFIKTNFGHLQFSRGVIGNNENQPYETLLEIMEDVKL